MNPTATLREVAVAQARAIEDGRWLLAHLLARWMVLLDEQHVPVYHCLGPGCDTMLPGDYVDPWCGARCAEAYRRQHQRAYMRVAVDGERSVPALAGGVR